MTTLSLPGRFGDFGGQYVPETLMPALAELSEALTWALSDEGFAAELDALHKDYVGRPTPLYRARRLEQHFGGAKIFLKREDLNHTGAHKINNALGQALLARKLGKHRIIAETGAGQHGVATATACALMGLDCAVYMGSRDIERQQPNVLRMKLLGAEVKPVSAGEATLKEATSEAIRDWVSNVATTHYILGSASGPHPYPTMVREFQAVIGRETKDQCLETLGKLPDYVLACVGGGSNAIGMFAAFLDCPSVRLVGLEAGGTGGDRHAATLTHGSPGVLHGTMSYLLQDGLGGIAEAHSISAGLDYPGVGPEHSHLKATGRATYLAVRDDQALEGFRLLARREGILCALETAHVIGYLEALMPETSSEQSVVINLSGRGDKDMPILQQTWGDLLQV